MNINLLRRLCETPGVSGREERVRELILKEVKAMFDETRIDAMGSLICTRRASKPGKGKTPRLMIAAHMDEIGFYVRHIDERGFLWLNPAGGFDTRNLFSRRVLVCGETGDHVGVMNPGGRPIHISREEDRKKIPDALEFFVDLGMDPRDVEDEIKIGDYVVMHEPFLEMPNVVVSKALDNRIACWVAIEAVRAIDKAKGDAGKHAAEIVVAFTVQEEVGLRGAQTAANQVNADYGIGLDVTLACDTPGVPDNERVTRQGDGVAIMWQDSSMIADYELSRDLCALAQKRKIRYQRCILPRGGQDGAAIQRANAGARAAAICVGTRYIHTVTETASKDDLKAAVDLLAAWMIGVKG
jgi:putative aminopeptidase FrvX